MSLVGKKGVDISSNNGSVDIAKIKSAGYDFVMIRCGFGENIRYFEIDANSGAVKTSPIVDSCVNLPMFVNLSSSISISSWSLKTGYRYSFPSCLFSLATT